MQKEIKITVGILVLAGILLIGNLALSLNFIRNVFAKGKEIISPRSDSASIFSFFVRHDKPNKTIYAYLPYWMIEEADNFQLDKLTDIAYFGLYLQKDGSFEKINDKGETDPGYNNWHNNKNLDDLIAKSKQYGVRVSLTVISHDDDTSDAFLNCRSCWNTFFDNLTKELDSKKISGVNLNFEYSGYVEDEQTRDNFTEFSKFLDDNLHDKYKNGNLVIATFADSVVKKRLTKIEDISKYCDGMFIMGYDFHRAQSDTTGAVAPMVDKTTLTTYDITSTINDYLSAAPPSKIILGVPYYGYNWVVSKDEPNTSVVKPEDIPNSASVNLPDSTDALGDRTGSVSQTYDAVMKVVQAVKPTIKWDDTAKAPYFTYKSPDTGLLRQVYYENAQSLAEKYKLIQNKDLAGVGIWALGYDGGYQELWVLLKDYFIK